MNYTPLKVRTVEDLNGLNFYPDPGTILDISRYVSTSKPAGSKGKIIAVGEYFEEANNPGVHVRFVGNNTAATLGSPLNKAMINDIVTKFTVKGYNYIRLHGIENYLMIDGVPYGTSYGRLGNRNYSPTRWDELDFFLYSLKQAGVYYSFGPASSNLVWNMNGYIDRYDRNINTSGTATAVISGGKVTAINLVTAGTGYWFPPAVVLTGVAGQEGYGAKAKAILNASGVITGYEVTDGGFNYTAAPTITHYGGNGTAKPRLRIQDEVKDLYKSMVSDILNHVNPYSGLAMKDDPALMFVECYNESHMSVLNSGAIFPSFIPLWQEWIAKRYGTIANLNTRYASSFTSFNDVGLIARIPGLSNSATVFDKWHSLDSVYFFNQHDVTFYKECTASIRAAGYTGMITTRDMGGDPIMPKIFYETNADFQTYHAYPSLSDVYKPNNKMNSGNAYNNAPNSFGTSALVGCLTAIAPGTPKFWTEAGYSMPAKYRGEYGPVFAAYSSMYNFSGICLHADALSTNKFGYSFNPVNNKSLYPHQYDHDPLCASSVFLMSLMFHRRDIDELPVDKTYVMNDKAMGNYKDPFETNTPNFGYRQIYAGIEFVTIPGMSRVEAVWDPTDNTAIGSAFLPERMKSIATQLTEAGYNSTHETYNWVVTKGNNSVSQDQTAGAIRYTRNRQVFADKVAGLFGINTPRTQLIVPSKPFTQGAANVVKYGDSYLDNTSRMVPNAFSNSYKLNFLGNRFWENLEVNYIEDGVLLGVTSSSMEPISSASTLIVVAASNCYNNGATWFSNASTIDSVPVTNGGSGFTSSPNISFTGGSGNSAVAVGIISGGVLTGVRMIDGGTGYVEGVVATVVGGGGTGAVLGAPVLVDDDPAKEILLATPWLSDGKEGWPFGIQRHVVDFNIIGVNNSIPWRLSEVNYSGQIIASYPVRKITNGINVRIDSSKLKAPSVYFQLTKVPFETRASRP